MQQKFASVHLLKPAAGALWALLLALSLPGCRDYAIKSLWLTDAIHIDGDASDWKGNLYYFEEKKASVGIKNDRENLYICLITQDPTRIRQATSLGMILWIDPAGGKDKQFGINYPVGQTADMVPRPERGEQPRDPEEMRERMSTAAQASREEIKFLDPDGLELGRVRIDEVQGMEVAVQSTGSTFVYEIRLPLSSSENLPLVFKSQSGPVLGVGMEMPKREMPSMRGSRPGGGMGGTSGRGGGMSGAGGRGSRGGGMSGMAGRPGGARGNFDPDLFKGVKIWAKVTLAKQ